MKISSARRNIVGLLTMPVSGIIALAALVIRGPLLFPGDGMTAWANETASGVYQITQLLVMAAFVLPFFGFVSLYNYFSDKGFSERMAYFGLLMSLIGTALALPSSGIFALAAPEVSRLFMQNQINASQVIVGSISGPGMIIGIVSAVLYTLGPIFLGLAIWKCNTLPKWAGVLFALHGALLSFGFSFFPALLSGWLLFAISGGWVAWSVSKSTSTT